MTQASKFDYPIVKHHPLFAKTRRGHSGISSLLVGENIEYTRYIDPIYQYIVTALLLSAYLLVSNKIGFHFDNRGKLSLIRCYKYMLFILLKKIFYLFIYHSI